MQFADDTKPLLDGTQQSLDASLNTLKVFGSISGLKMNTDKTKVIWKTFLISQLNHIFLALQNPPSETLKEIITILLKFLWDNKPDKTKRKEITLPIKQDGINMIDIEFFIT